MRQFMLALPLVLTPAAAALADTDACTAEIRALFDGGGLDPFVRPPNRQRLEVSGPDGAPLYVLEGVVVDPLHQISGISGSGQFMLMVGRESWTGPTPDGPWSPTGMMQAEDIEAAQRAVPADMAANVTEAECPGVVDTPDGARVHFRFRTRVDPNPARGNSWWGAYHAVWLDPDTSLPMEWVMTQHVASWQDGVKDERHVLSISYDDTLVIARPE